MIERQTIHSSSGRNKITIGVVNHEYDGWSFAHNLYWLQLIYRLYQCMLKMKNPWRKVENHLSMCLSMKRRFCRLCKDMTSQKKFIKHQSWICGSCVCDGWAENRGVVVTYQTNFLIAGEPDKELNPKKKVWEQVQPDLRTDGQCVATYKGAAFEVAGKGVCKAQTMSNSGIK